MWFRVRGVSGVEGGEGARMKINDEGDGSGRCEGDL